MKSLKGRLAASCAMIAALAPATAHAGHMFTQASSNTPTWIQAGQGIAIQQYGDEGGSGVGMMRVYFEAPTTIPAAADTSNNDWWQWSAGDIISISLPLNGTTYTTTVAYDAASGTCAYDFCGITSASLDVTNSALGTIGSLPAHSGEVGSGIYTASDVYFGWSIVSLAGEFSLGGYRLYTSAGTIDGTGAGPLDQSSVVSADQATSGGGGGGGPRPITNADDVIGGLGSTTTYQFDGGNLVTDADISASFTITDNGGSMGVAAGATQTMSGVLADESGASGAFGKMGDGTLILSGANTHTGGTAVHGGVLQIASNDNLGAATGGVTLDGGTLATTADITTDRAFTIGTNGGGVAAASGTTLTLSGTSTGTGTLTSSGAGTLNVTGSLTAGGFSQTAGRLNVGGTLTADTTIGSGAILSGSGTITGDLVNSGTIAAGNSPGTLTVAGDVTLDGTSVVDIEIDGLTYSASGGAGSYDRIAVTGATSTFTADGEIAPILRGISGAANNTFDPSIGDAFRVVTTENTAGVSGEFALVTNPTTGLPVNTRFDVIYGADFIDLVLTPDSYATFVAGFGIQNLTNFATAFDGIRPTAGNGTDSDLNTLVDGLYGLNGTDLSVALLQLSGQIHAFALADVSTMGRAGTDTVFNQMRSGVRTGNNVWFDMSGNTASFDEDHIATASDNTGRSFWLGTDLSSTEAATFGIAGGYGSSEVDAGVYGSTENDANGFALYAFGSNGNLVWDGVISSSKGEIHGTRTTSLSSGDIVNTFYTTANTTTLKGRLGYNFELSSSIDAITWLGAEMNSVSAKGYTEGGSSVTALTIAAQDYDTKRINVGLELVGDISDTALWTMSAGAVRTLDSGDQYITRNVSLHGAEWEVSEANFGATTKYLNFGVSRAAGDNIDYWAELGLTNASGMTGRQAAIGIDYRW